MPTTVHDKVEVDGAQAFFRHAGPPDAPVLLCPHGYPCSSFEFRDLIPALADRWRVVAPDFPGFGLSATPEGFAYRFDGYAEFLTGFADALGLERYVLYLHDYGSQIGLRHAIAHPERVAGLIVQNGDIYEDVLGPKYDGLKAYFAGRSPEAERKLREAISKEGFREEFAGDLPERLRPRVPPDLWELAWVQLNTPERREIMFGLMDGLEANLAWFPRYQAYLREHRPPTLILWGPHDGYMPEESGRAYLRDLPEAELHVLDAGHWLLETHLDEAVPLIRDFLARVQIEAVTFSAD